jgi:hypothetical protein
MITAGFVLAVVGILLIITPNVLGRIQSFFQDFSLVEIAPNFFLPAPRSDHPFLYATLQQLCIILAVFQIFVLVLRFYLRDPPSRIASTVSSFVFWVGSYYVVGLLIGKLVGWFGFLGWIVVLVGLSIIIQSLIVLMSRPVRRN